MPLARAVLPLFALAACARSAPAPPSPVAPVPDRALARLALHVALAPGAHARHLALAPPDALDLLAVDLPSPVTYVLDPARITTGAAAASTVWRALFAHAPLPPPARLVQLLAPVLYPALPAFDGAAWREPFALTDVHGLPPAPPPVFVVHPAGGHALVFAYVIPSGRPGAGPHLANLRLTDSGLVIDEAPHPERR